MAVLVLGAATIGPDAARGESALVLGDAFTVNTVTRGSQAFPATAVNSAGAAVVVWRCEDPDLSPGICARRFSSTGRALGSELRVNTFTAGVQGEADVAIDDQGHFVVVWESNGQDGDQQGIYSQRFDEGGAPVGIERRVNTTTVGRQRRPSVAMAADGRFVVVWDSQGKDPSQEAVVLRRYGVDGSAIGGEVVVNSETSGQQWQAEVAMAPGGRFVVSWETGAYPTGGGNDIAVQRYTSNGTRAGPELLVNTFTASTQNRPSVAIAPDGRFVVVWESFTQDGSDQGIYAQRFSAAGVAVGPERRVNSATQGIQIEASVALSGEVAVVVWRDAERRRIVVRCLDADGAPLGGEVTIDDTFPSLPSIAADVDGDLVIAWQDTGPEISARLGRLDQACVAGEFSLCLNDGRFEIEVSWRDPSGRSGSGHVRALTPDSGYSWFFEEDNVELVVKVLDGCALNDRYWVFLAGLTNVEVEVVVTDTGSGASRSYRNPQGSPFVLVRDTAAFASCADDASTSGGNDLLMESRSLSSPAVSLAAGTGAWSAAACVSGPAALCLNDSRFRARATFRTRGGQSGPAGAASVTDDTGTLWFFDPDNVEVMVKVLDACALNGHFWVFAAGLTDVEVELTVIDTDRDRQRVYRNPLNRPYELVTDVEAFACP